MVKIYTQRQAEAIIKEYYARIRVESVFPKLFDLSNPNSKVRRGELHNKVAEALGLPINNKLVKEIRNYMLNNLPVRFITIDGKQYYKGIRFK